MVASSPRATDRLALKIAGSIALVAASVALGEAALRVAVRIQPSLRSLFPDPLEVTVEPQGRFGFRPRPGSKHRYANGSVATTNDLGYRGPTVTIPKPVGTVRILLLGGSTTHGWGVGDSETIDAHMRELFLTMCPGGRFEVVNLAFDGYDSYQLFERLRSDGLRLEPDFVIVNAGINDVYNAKFPNLGDPDPRTLTWEPVLQRLREDQRRGRPGLWSLAKHYSYVARVPSMIRLVAARRAQAKATVTVTGYPDAADNFQRNLLRIAELLPPSVPVLFSTPPSALRDHFDPTRMQPRSYWLADVSSTQAYRDTLAARAKAVAGALRSNGRQAAYVAPQLDGHLFLDDAHLTGPGNRAVARVFVQHVMAWMSRDESKRGMCRYQDVLPP
ncbi:MAG TPA: SGNH/GDSL hydrolase family protein [Gemmatimonadales bacterium]|nr:SGNH/GDSL hydrolase family protein [Gemmatimonadales bacterium]